MCNARINNWNRLALAILLVGALSTVTQAATIGHWRFEDSPGFLNDSSGNGNTLSVVGTVTQATLPAGSRGAAFPNPVPLTTTPNLKAADLAGTSDYLRNTAISSSPSTGFTYETFLHWEDTANSNESFADMLMYSGTLSLQIRTDGFGGTDADGEFMLAFDDSTTTRKYIYSGFSPLMDTDYYFALAMDMPSQTANFYIKDLTNDGPLQIISRAHTGIGSLPASSYAEIGSANVSVGSFDFDGLFDEIRFSDVALSLDDLLITAAPVPVPEPSSALLLGLGACVLVRAGQRRKRNV